MKKKPSATQLIRRVVYHAERHPASDLSIGALAKRCELSPFHFQRLFREMMGESVKQFVLRIRLQRAALILKTSDYSITAVALETGFVTHAGFTKAFRRSYKISPTAYRKRYWQDAKKHSALAEAAPVDTTALIEDAAILPTIGFEQQPTRFVAAVRYVGPTEGVLAAWAQLYGWAQQWGVWEDDTRCFGFHYDDWRGGERPSYRYDAAIELPLALCEQLVATNEAVSNECWAPNSGIRRPFRKRPAAATTDVDVAILSIPGGAFGSAAFEGTLEEYDRRWWWLIHKWLPQSGYALRTEYVLDRYPATHLSSAGDTLKATSYLPLSRQAMSMCC